MDKKITKQSQKCGINSKNIQIGRDLNIQQGYSYEEVQNVAVEILNFPEKTTQPMTGESLLSLKEIQSHIYIIRGHKVMLDKDLSKLYDVETRILNRNVKRNIARFPQDFRFQLSKEENDALLKIRGEYSTKYGGRRYLPHVFTQEGVAMLSSVLTSDRAIQVNVEVMRAFVQFRYMLSSDRELLNRINKMEQRYDQKFKVVFDALRELMQKSHGDRKYLTEGKRQT